MKIIQSITQMQETILTHKNQTIGFVPTMGFLHEGHLSLVTQAKKENDIVIMSIFVNPLQFGPNEDFDEYPRDEINDERLARAAGVDYLFFPSQEEMYPHNMSVEMKMTARVNVLCGASRPGHFDGVITVVTKLFHIVQPTRAYFGLKDAQQVAVIHALIHDLNFPIQLRALATVREEDGLAKSSRNKYLTKEERINALSIQKALEYGKILLKEQDGNLTSVKTLVESYLMNHSFGEIDYVELLEYPSFAIATKESKQIIIALAVKYSKARLIDNYILDNRTHEQLNVLDF